MLMPKFTKHLNSCNAVGGDLTYISGESAHSMTGVKEP